MRTKDKRDYILELYTKQIETIPFVSSEGVEFHMADAYICPLCLHAYAIGNTELTLEHVPPESVGGKPILITCKACNSNLGADIDVYLMNELEIVHNLNHLDTIPQKTKLAFNGVEINAQTTFSKTDGFTFMISPDNNNPIEFKGFMTEAKNAKKGYEIKVVANITNRKRDYDLANIALLKSAYLMAFHELGYMYVLNANTSIIRDQIQNPKKNVIGNAFIIDIQNGVIENLPDGVYYAQLNNIGCVIVIMELRLRQSEIKHRKVIVLPHPKDSHGQIYSELFQRIGKVVNVRIFGRVSLLPATKVKLDESIKELCVLKYKGEESLCRGQRVT